MKATSLVVVQLLIAVVAVHMVVSSYQQTAALEIAVEDFVAD